MSTVSQIVRKSQATLFWCLRGLPKAQREAIYTLFAFCKHIDYIVSSPMSARSKQELLDAWKVELDNIYDKKVPVSNIGRKIYKNCMRFKIQKNDFSTILQAALLDFPRPIRAPTDEEFEIYCQGTAIMPIYITLLIMGEMGEPTMRLLSRQFGKALVLTNILRNIKDDALNGHLYIPKSMLLEAQIDTQNPMEAIVDPRIVAVREKMGQIASSYFYKTYKLLFSRNRKTMRSLRFVFSIYKRYFDIMQNRGFEIMSPKPEIKPLDKMAIAINTIFDKY